MSEFFIISRTSIAATYDPKEPAASPHEDAFLDRTIVDEWGVPQWVIEITSLRELTTLSKKAVVTGDLSSYKGAECITGTIEIYDTYRE